MDNKCIDFKQISRTLAYFVGEQNEEGRNVELHIRKPNYIINYGRIPH